MPPVRVAFLIWSLAGGGAERQLVTLVRGLDRARFDPVVIVRRIDSAYGDVGAPCVELGARGWTPRSFYRLVQTLRALRPAALYTVMDPENLWGRLAARAAGVPRVIAGVRCPALPSMTVWSERLTRDLVDAWIVNSVGIRDALSRACDVPLERVTVVENGVDLARFDAPVDVAAVRARYDVGDRTWLVLPGRISPEKNQLALLRALASLLEAGVARDSVRLLLAGANGLDARYVRAVDEALASPPLRGVVSRPGFVRDVDEVLRAADAALLPSRYEGLSNAVIEAMAAGCPVMVTAGANRDGLVTDGEEGWALGEASEAVIREGVARVLAATRAQRRAMGARGRASARHRFDASRMVRATEEALDRALSGRA